MGTTLCINKTMIVDVNAVETLITGGNMLVLPKVGFGLRYAEAL